MAKGKRYSEEQIIKVLGEIDAGASIASVARVPGISVQTICGWRERYSGMIKYDLTAMRALQDEKRRLSFIVSEVSLDQGAAKRIEPYCSEAGDGHPHGARR